MNEFKCGADLCNDERIGGHIIISDDTFIWKPVKLGFLGANIDPIEVLVSSIEGYMKKGSTLFLRFYGHEEFLAFYTWKGDAIINEIKKRNQIIVRYEPQSSSKGGCLSSVVIFIVSLIALSCII